MNSISSQQKSDSLENGLVPAGSSDIRNALVLTLVWAVEVFVVQEATFVVDLPLNAVTTCKHWLFRFLIDFTSMFLVVTICSRGVLLLVSILNTLFSAGVLTYYTCFKSPLSALTLLNQSGEGIEVLDSVSSMMPRGAAVLLTVGLVLRSWLIWRRPLFRLSRPVIWLAPTVVVGGLAFAATFVRPIDVFDFHGRSFWGHLYGYTCVWSAELLTFDQDVLMSEAERARTVRSSQLSGVLPSVVARGNIIVLQAESLDFDAVGLRVDGRPVMPFLSQAAADGYFLPVEPVHLTGSADADFVLLTGHMPNGIVPPYLPGLTIDEPLPRQAHQRGLECFAYHGNRGTFFERRSGFRELEFDGVFFESELLDLGLPQSHWGVADHHVFDFVGRRVCSQAPAAVHFIISLTTHTPWRTIPDCFGEFDSSDTSTQGRLVNALWYLDQAIEQLYSSLPDGTLLIVYGDHSAAVDLGQGKSGHEGKVPLIVLLKGADLPQPDYDQIPDSLSMLDAASFVSDVVRASDPQPVRASKL